MKAEKTGNTGTPLQIALGSIKANRVPMVALWGVVTALAVAYWNIPAVATCRRGYLRRVYVPNLISNWVVWIPAVAAVYAFDQDLQIQALGFVSCFWALVCLQLGKRAEGQ